MRPLPRRLGYGEEATLVEHLEELRQRLFVCLGVLVLGFVVAFAFHGHLLTLLNKPLPPDIRKPVTLNVAEPFMTSMWVSLYAGVLVALPVIVWQAWSFFMPAVDDRHSRMTAYAVAFATVLLGVGVVFGYYVALPKAIDFLTNFDQDKYTIMIQARQYYSFVVMVMLAMAVVFELPVFVLGLVWLGILSSATLRRTRRIGYFLVVCIAVALPGIDPVTTMLEAIPLVVLYELSIWLSVLVERRQAAPQQAVT